MYWLLNKSWKTDLFDRLSVPATHRRGNSQLMNCITLFPHQQAYNLNTQLAIGEQAGGMGGKRESVVHGLVEKVLGRISS